MCLKSRCFPVTVFGLFLIAAVCPFPSLLAQQVQTADVQLQRVVIASGAVTASGPVTASGAVTCTGTVGQLHRRFHGTAGKRADCPVGRGCISFK